MLKIPGRIPITIYPLFWLLAAAIGWISTESFTETLVWVVVIFCSIVIHEYGHALSAIAFGQQAQIELMGFGGVTQRIGKRIKLWQEFVVVLNGPLAGFSLCFIAWWLGRMAIVSQSHAMLLYTLNITFYVNMFWTIMNLFPIQPLDGGKLLSIILEAFFGIKGVKIALFISLVLSSLLALFLLMMKNFIAGSLFLILAYESYRMWKNSLAVTSQDEDVAFHESLKEAEQDLLSGQTTKALEKFQTIRNSTQTGLIHLFASQQAARLLTNQGDYVKAYEILQPMAAKLDPDGLILLHQLSFQMHHWKEALTYGRSIYQSKPNHHTAVLNAACHSALKEVRPAIGWLQCALRADLPNFKEVIKNGEFDPIRSDPEFLQFCQSIR